jgi:hypothetical protein
VKGTITDFLALVVEQPVLAKELVELAAKYGFEFSNELSDEDLENVAGGTQVQDMRLQRTVETSALTTQILSNIVGKVSNTQDSITRRLD